MMVRTPRKCKSIYKTSLNSVENDKKSKKNKVDPGDENGQNKQPARRVNNKIRTRASKTLIKDTENIQGKMKTTSVPTAKLRERKYQNYAESSFETSQLEAKSENVNKIPVYKQAVISHEHEVNKKGDLYDFDMSEDSDYVVKKQKPQKQHKRVKKLFVVGVKTTMDKPVKKVVKIKKLEAAVKNKRRSKEYEKKISAIVQNALQKVKNNNNNNNSKLKEAAEVANAENKTPLQNDFNTDTDDLEQDDVIVYDDNNPYFGFDDIENVEPSKKINIISDVLVGQSNNEINLNIATPAKIKKPNANSTFINNVLSPWRFNEINIRRNPHYISIKESALPCLGQDMVLDHVTVDKFMGSWKNSTTVERSHKKPPVQTTLADYFEGNFDNKENVQDLSLFDADNFSPIKRNVAVRNPITRAKRKILGETSDNIVRLQNSPPPEISSEEKHNEDELNFGFTTDEDEDVADTNVSKREKHAKPYRVSVNIHDKKYARKRRKIERTVSVASNSEEEQEPEDSFTDLESHNEEVHIFDEFDTTENNVEELKSRKRKKKTKWLNDSDECQPPRRRKDIRTQSEEEAAEKWAQEFNSMCAEVEKFPLEIV